MGNEYSQWLCDHIEHVQNRNQMDEIRQQDDALKAHVHDFASHLREPRRSQFLDAMSIVDDHVERVQRASLAKTERLIRQGCTLCGESMFYEDVFGHPIPRGILVVNNSGVECDGSVMSSPVSVPVCYACADRLGISYKKGA